MTRLHRQMMFVAALLMPLSSLLAEYTPNAEYLDFSHVCMVGIIFAMISAVGYGVFWLLFRSSLSALLGCVMLWGAFFAFIAIGEWVKSIAPGYPVEIIGYFGLGLALALGAAYFVRSTNNTNLSFIGPLALGMAVIMLAANFVPAIRTASSVSHSPKDLAYKSSYRVDSELPSPNVYWIHADGMLGFDAMEKYFGDPQIQLRQDLDVRGFKINTDAYLEGGHKTVIAVAALMNPYFFDETMKKRLSSHEEAIKMRTDYSFLRNGLDPARAFNETRIAFDEKGYTTQTLAFFNRYFPPIADRFYEVSDSRGAYTMQLGDHPENTYMSILDMTHLASLLTTVPRRHYSDIIWELGDMGVENFECNREPLQHQLDEQRINELLLGSADAKRYKPLMNALNDALYVPGPTFNIVYFYGAHFPFIYDEFGHYTQKDSEDLYNYPQQHRFATKLLLNTIDIILQSDPDAVIVVQADHGLHGQTREEIGEKLGEEAVLPLWNQVFSAMRVPEKYQNSEEKYAMEDPLNISRYLVNNFVGENYKYIQ